MERDASSNAFDWRREAPPPHVRQLFRDGAADIVRAPREWLATLERELLSQESTTDPALAAALSRVFQALFLEWANANVVEPGYPVTPRLDRSTLEMARDLVRLGLSDLALTPGRTGLRFVWLHWMELVFGLSTDPATLRVLLEVSTRSLSEFMSAAFLGVSAQMQTERELLLRESHSAQLEVVTLVLQGAPIAPSIASQRLGYALDQMHRAAVVWSEETNSELSALERVSEALSRSLGGRRPLTIVADAATLWVWVAVETEAPPSHLLAALQESRGVRVSVGSLGRSVEGFRRSHLDALTAQRMLARSGSSDRMVSFDEVRLVALLMQDTAAARAFAWQTLGQLASADMELREALRVFLQEGCNASRAAEVLRTHRNTLQRRLARAEDLLPEALERNRLHVAAALDVIRYL